jgi:hypothetical protein
MMRSGLMTTLEEAKAGFRRSGMNGSRGRSWKRCPSVSHSLGAASAGLSLRLHGLNKEKPRRRWGRGGAFNGRFA